MQTHRDDDDAVMPRKLSGLARRLEAKAKAMTEAMTEAEKHFATGEPGEEPLRDMRGGRFFVRRLPGDENGVMRISVGGHPEHPDTCYLCFRGDPVFVYRALKDAAVDIVRFIESSYNND